MFTLPSLPEWTVWILEDIKELFNFLHVTNILIKFLKIFFCYIPKCWLVE